MIRWDDFICGHLVLNDGLKMEVSKKIVRFLKISSVGFEPKYMVHSKIPEFNLISNAIGLK